MEHGFRELKHTLEVRPMYHFSERRIKAHIFVCFMALVISCIMEKRLKDNNIDLSFEKALFELKKIKLINYTTTSNVKSAAINEVTNTAKRIFKGLNITPPTYKKTVG